MLDSGRVNAITEVKFIALSRVSFNVCSHRCITAPISPARAWAGPAVAHGCGRRLANTGRWPSGPSAASMKHF